MLKDDAARVFQRLEDDGLKPRLHEPEDENGVFEIHLDGAGYDLDDFKTLVRVGADFGLGLKLDDRGGITLS
jgi:hypothetical protein